MDLFSVKAIAAERERQAEGRRLQRAHRQADWRWILKHEPLLAELLQNMKAARMPASGVEWLRGGPRHEPSGPVDNIKNCDSSLVA